jgi:hypothetical protein
MTAFLASLGLCSPGMAHPPLRTWKGAVAGNHRSGDPKDLDGLQPEVELAARKAAITSHIGGGCYGPTAVTLNDVCFAIPLSLVALTPQNPISR